MIEEKEIVIIKKKKNEIEKERTKECVSEEAMETGM